MFEFIKFKCFFFIFQNYNEESNKVFEVSAISIANERHKESPKDGMKEIINAIETNLRHLKVRNAPKHTQFFT